MIEKEILKKAIEHYGEEYQMLKFVEELGEAVTAVARFALTLNEKTEKELIDEVADVLIMSEQIRIILGAAEIDNRIAYKLDRLNKRIENDK
jgi:NTP pyrophosphatase (non-canonical NTP hydrolase)